MGCGLGYGGQNQSVFFMLTFCMKIGDLAKCCNEKLIFIAKNNCYMLAPSNSILERVPVVEIHFDFRRNLLLQPKQINVDYLLQIYFHLERIPFEKVPVVKINRDFVSLLLAQH